MLDTLSAKQANNDEQKKEEQANIKDNPYNNAEKVYA